MAPFTTSSKKPEKLSKTISDLSFQLSKATVEAGRVGENHLPTISESVEIAKCECCGMFEDCTPEYIKRVREKLRGKWICGLCTEAVKEEVERNGGKEEEALDAHMSACVRFNRFGRANPVLSQAEAMREMLRKKSVNKCGAKRGVIARSSSCIPAIMKEINEHAVVN